MTLSALLVCTDESEARVLHRVLEELEIRVEACPDFARAAMRLAQERFDAAVLNGNSNGEVLTLLRDTMVARRNDSTLTIAVVSGQENIREMFSQGVNFVLYKPVSHERALSSLRAARAAMRKERRKSGRATVHAHATVDYANVEREKATLVNLAQDGMSVLFGKKFPPTSKVYFQFQLPGQSISIRLSGQLVWQDWNGRAGFQFVDVPKASRKLLTDFLSHQLPSETRQEHLPQVTVDVEDPLELVTVGAERYGNSSERTTSRETVTHHEAAAEALKDDKRSQVRYACRLGAEVYRTGTSVPNHCCLADLSAGGCYLEVSLPFPSGSSVEIVVRADDLKLRMRGTVQASHPGYGMGVAFELKTREECDSVAKLTEFVSAHQQ